MYFIQKYLEYNSGNEAPRNFHVWSALAVISAVVSRKVFVSQGYFKHHANIYACLVAEQGERKSTAKDIARDILVETFPNIPVAPSVTTREAITKFLGSDESIRTFTDEHGTIIEYHPYVLFVNELKNFLSVNPGGMIDFLTDIYDRAHFIVETKNKGTDIIPNPSITFLACETTSWMIRKYKEDLITGGFSRRVNVIYEPSNETIIPRPMPPVGSDKILDELKAHLRKINEVVGQFKWTKNGEDFFDNWYIHNRKTLPTDAILRGYRRTKDVQLLKIAMLLALCEENPKLLLTEALLEVALATLDASEVHLPKLTMSAGRNELAVPQQRILELIEHYGGEMAEKQLLRETSKDLSPMEQTGVIRFLVDTEQLFRVPKEVAGVKRIFLVSRDKIIRDSKRAAPAK